MSRYAPALLTLKKQNRLRSLHLPCGIDLTSNDYLGMASHPALRAAALEALQNGLDIGAAGSRLLRGHTETHAALEAFAARHFKAEKTLFFTSGFQANYALLTTLPARGDIIFYDSLVHASMRDGIEACPARSYKFPHNDLNALEDLLKRHRDKAEQIWIAVESVYSMDGDQAPLLQLYDLAANYEAMMIVDEAHATGIFGRNGKGACWDLVLKHGYERLITLHTCGKAIGVAGLVCASADIIDFLVNRARPFIYSTAPMPLQALLVQKSLEILAAQEGEERREKLFSLCTQAKALFGGVGTQIVPVILGSEETALQLAAHLQGLGYDIRAIRPPTVPEGTARLRLSLGVHLENPVLQAVADEIQLYRENLSR